MARASGKVVSSLFVIGVALTTATPQGEAAFPGANGKIVFVSSRDGNPEIYVMNWDGTSPTRLTNNAAYDDAPVWSPDGRKIAFSSDRDGNFDIFVMNADGTGVINVTSAMSAFSSNGNPAWAPDGSRIAFEQRVSARRVGPDRPHQLLGRRAQPDLVA